MIRLSALPSNIELVFVFKNPFGASIFVIHLQFDKRTNILALQGKFPGTNSVKDGIFLD